MHVVCTSYVWTIFNFSLGPLVNKVKENQVETIVDALCTNMISENEQLRDICSIGLKTVISELPITNTPLAANVCRRITGKLTSAIEKVKTINIAIFFNIIYELIIFLARCICTVRSFRYFSWFIIKIWIIITWIPSTNSEVIITSTYILSSSSKKKVINSKMFIIGNKL